MIRFRLYLLGRFEATLDDQPITAFRSDKARALLAYLVLGRERDITRIQLTELLWPGYSAPTGRASLRVVFSNLRQLIAPLNLLHATYKKVQFWSQHPQFWCDALALENALHNATLPAELLPTNFQPGDFLRGFEDIDSSAFNHWLYERRSYYDQMLEQLQQRTVAAPKSFVSAGQRGLSIALEPPLIAPPEPLVISTNGTGAPAPQPPELLSPPILNQAPDPGPCYGRVAELAQLQQWLVTEHCRVVVLLGMGGQGKTTLAATLAQQLATPAFADQHFAGILWHSLVNAPALPEILQSWWPLLSANPETHLPSTQDRQLECLVELLNRQRWLLVLDNVEGIMLAGERAGYYRPGYEGYGQLFERLATGKHQSCLLLTSREEPHEIKRLAVGAARCRTLQLAGLSSAAGQTLLAVTGLRASAAEAEQVVAHYSGNPLALKLVATTIHDLFASDVQTFLTTAPTIFDDIRDVLDQQFARLSELERAILYWLAIEREPVTLATLQQNLIVAQPPWALLEATRSLHRRALLEQVNGLIGLQNVITEYMTERLVEAIATEIQASSLATLAAGRPRERGGAAKLASQCTFPPLHLNHYALVKAQAQEYVRSTQVRLLLEPVAAALRETWGIETVATRMQVLLHRLRLDAPLMPGYAAANLLHLLLHLQIDLRGFDFSRLTLKQADLRAARLPQVNLTQAALVAARFLEPMEQALTLTFSTDGSLLIAGTYNGDIYLWRIAERQPLHIFKGHQGLVYTVALSPDNRLLASGGIDGTIRLWDMATQQLYYTLRGHTGPIHFLGFDATGEWLFSSGEDKAVRVWALSPHGGDSQPLQLHRVIPNTERFIAVHPSGRLVVSTRQHKQVAGWNVATGEVSFTLDDHTAALTGLTISPDGKTLVTASVDQTIRVWTIVAPDQSPHLRYLLAAPNDSWLKPVFSPDSQTLACGVNGQIWVWDISSGELRLRLSKYTATIRTLAFHPNGRTLVSASQDQTIRLWNLSSGQEESALQGYSFWIDFAFFSPAGLTLASFHLDRTVTLWDPQSEQTYPLQLLGNRENLYTLYYSPDGKTLAAPSYGTAVYLWEVATHTLSCVLPERVTHPRTLAFHPTAPLLATGSTDYNVRLWDSKTGELRTTLPGHNNQICFLTFNPDGAVLASASYDQTIALWTIDAAGYGHLCHRLYGHTSPDIHLAFHSSGAWLASGGDGVRLWDVERGQLCEIVQEPTKNSYHVAFSPNGAWLISLSVDSSIRIWAVRATATPPGCQCQLRHVLQETILKAAHVAISPDSTTLAVRGADRTVRLLDLESGQLRRVLTGHESPVTSISYSPDGRQLSSSSSDGTIRIWDPQNGACLQVLRVEVPYAGMNITGVSGITEAQKVALKALGAVED